MQRFSSERMRVMSLELSAGHTCAGACSRCRAGSRMLQMHTLHSVRPPAGPRQRRDPLRRTAVRPPAPATGLSCVDKEIWLHTGHG